MAIKASPAPAKPAAPHAPADIAQWNRDKSGKLKVVRDSFIIPKTEYSQIADQKKRALAMGKVLGKIPTLKTGRPGKD